MGWFFFDSYCKNAIKNALLLGALLLKRLTIAAPYYSKRLTIAWGGFMWLTWANGT